MHGGQWHHFEGLEAEEEALILEIGWLNTEETLKDNGIGMQQVPHRNIPLSTSWQSSDTRFTHLA